MLNKEKLLGDCETTLIHGDGGQMIDAKFIQILDTPEWTSYTVEFNESVSIKKGDIIELKQTFKEINNDK